MDDPAKDSDAAPAADDDTMVDADSGEDAADAVDEKQDDAAGSPEADALTGFAAGQAAGNIHLAGDSAETMDLAAASREAQVMSPGRRRWRASLCCARRCLPECNAMC